MTRTAIFISGSGSNMVALLRAMQAGLPAEPVLVLSDRANAPGLAKAAALGVTAPAVPRSDYTDRAAFEDGIQRHLDECGAEFICLAGFMRVLSPAFVERWQARMLNIHPSLLPKYPGLDTHARALAAGDREAGCSVHEVTADLDAGPVRGQARLAVAPGETPSSLARRVLALEHRLYPATLTHVLVGGEGVVELREAGASAEDGLMLRPRGSSRPRQRHRDDTT